MIKIRPDKNWLHYVSVVGYDGQNIFAAESLAELSNCNEPHYNRRIPAKEFKKLWNTAMPKNAAVCEHVFYGGKIRGCVI